MAKAVEALALYAKYGNRYFFVTEKVRIFESHRTSLLSEKHSKVFVIVLHEGWTFVNVRNYSLQSM